jgi:hypothetical protein
VPWRREQGLNNSTISMLSRPRYGVEQRHSGYLDNRCDERRCQDGQ